MVIISLFELINTVYYIAITQLQQIQNRTIFSCNCNIEMHEYHSDLKRHLLYTQNKLITRSMKGDGG